MGLVVVVVVVVVVLVVISCHETLLGTIAADSSSASYSVGAVTAVSELLSTAVQIGKDGGSVVEDKTAHALSAAVLTKKFPNFIFEKFSTGGAIDGG